MIRLNKIKIVISWDRSNTKTVQKVKYLNIHSNHMTYILLLNFKTIEKKLTIIFVVPKYTWPYKDILYLS